tara:strand:+ start:3677 stop:4060 length:384 start_codon:yes stop_codon:yes gene_type:complete
MALSHQLEKLASDIARVASSSNLSLDQRTATVRHQYLSEVADELTRQLAAMGGGKPRIRASKDILILKAELRGVELKIDLEWAAYQYGQLDIEVSVGGRPHFHAIQAKSMSPRVAASEVLTFVPQGM